MTTMPSTKSLVVFETAARKLNFLRTAEEMNLTAGAVSRQIQSLEELLGAPLFERHHRRVSLTRLGQSYLNDIRGPLEQIAQATARARDSLHFAALSICAYPTFAIRWFIPRWGRFYDRHPDVDIRLTTSLNPADFASGDYDMAIQVLRENARLPAGLEAHKLIDVETFPVCSPAVAEQINGLGDIKDQTLLHGSPRPEDWRRWLETAGVNGVDSKSGLYFNSLNLSLQASIEGLGLAIAIAGLVRDDLDAGRLVRPFIPSRHSGQPFQLVYPRHKIKDPRLIALRDWLLEEAAMSSR